MKVLVIGYGNTLRGDDGVGPQVAEQVAAWQLPGVRSQAVHQLTPELAADIAETDLVWFVDAWQVTAQAAPRWERLVAAPSTARLDHTWSPALLLHLAKTLYGAEPVAYQLLIPAVRFDYGEGLSEVAQAGVIQSQKILKEVLGGSKTGDHPQPQAVKSVHCHSSETPVAGAFPLSPNPFSPRVKGSRRALSGFPLALWERGTVGVACPEGLGVRAGGWMNPVQSPGRHRYA